VAWGIKIAESDSGGADPFVAADIAAVVIAASVEAGVLDNPQVEPVQDLRAYRSASVVEVADVDQVQDHQGHIPEAEEVRNPADQGVDLAQADTHVEAEAGIREGEDGLLACSETGEGVVE